MTFLYLFQEQIPCFSLKKTERARSQYYWTCTFSSLKDFLLKRVFLIEVKRWLGKSLYFLFREMQIRWKTIGCVKGHAGSWEFVLAKLFLVSGLNVITITWHCDCRISPMNRKWWTVFVNIMMMWNKCVFYIVIQFQKWINSVLIDYLECLFCILYSTVWLRDSNLSKMFAMG